MLTEDVRMDGIARARKIGDRNVESGVVPEQLNKCAYCDIQVRVYVIFAKNCAILLMLGKGIK
jgi:hypothetical protein